MEIQATVTLLMHDLSRIEIKNPFPLLLLVIGLSLFPVSPLAAQTFSTLYNFSALDANGLNSDGAGPYAGLVLSGNTLYGTTQFGGTGQSCCFAGGDGVVFSLNTDGTGFAVLYTFSAAVSGQSNSDGAFPLGKLVCSGNTIYGTAQEGGQAGNGTVFCLNNDGTGFTVLYSFSALDYSSSPAVNSDGAEPLGGLVLSGDTLYGTTSAGGSGGGGTVFSLNTNGTGFQALYSFTTTVPSSYYGTNSDGAISWAGLALSGGTLYGTTRNGGTGGVGAVFALNTDGTGFDTLHNFTADPNGTNADGARPYSTLALSGDTLYGTTDEGGTGGAATVFALNTDGSGFRTLHSFSAPSHGTNLDGASLPAGVILSGDTLYGAANGGGAAGYGTAFKLRTDGTGFSVLHTFGEGPKIDAGPHGELLLFGNTLYGATPGGSFGSGEIFSISLPVIPPQLTLAAGGGNVVLAWPTNTGGFDYSGYTLQSTTNLTPPATWTAVPQAPLIINGYYTVTNPISGAQQFFRLSTGLVAQAQVTLTVPGTADPWLAGMPNGSTASYGDVAPDQSPVEVTGLPLTAGTLLVFSASGGVAYEPGIPLDPPDGNPTITIRNPAHDPGAENGLPDCRAPYDSLLGVFLGPEPPNLSPTPAPLDFSDPSQQDYTTLAPGLKQIFFIGDGLTTAGIVQRIVVPDGAARLFLGTLDGSGWANNVGSFAVVVAEQ